MLPLLLWQVIFVLRAGLGTLFEIYAEIYMSCENWNRILKIKRCSLQGAFSESEKLLSKFRETKKRACAGLVSQLLTDELENAAEYAGFILRKEIIFIPYFEVLTVKCKNLI